VYRHIALGMSLPEALALATRETSSSSNFVCIGAFPTPSMSVPSHTSHARSSPGPASSTPVDGVVAERPANGGRGGNTGALTMDPSHATVPFQWGTPPGV